MTRLIKWILNGNPSTGPVRYDILDILWLAPFVALLGVGIDHAALTNVLALF
jgi:hypothetical protein